MVISFAFASKLFPLLIVIELCFIVLPASFVTVPSIVKFPVPFITFAFVPPVNTTNPSLSIPPVALTAVAFVVTFPVAPTLTFSVVLIAPLVSLPLVNVPLTVIFF